MAIETGSSPALVPVVARTEPREERPSKDVAAFERWLTSERSPSHTNAAVSEQAVQAGTMSTTHAARDADQSMALDSVVFEWTATATYLMSYVDHRGRGHDVAVPNPSAADGHVLAQLSSGPSSAAPPQQVASSRASSVPGLHAAGAGLPAAFTADSDTDRSQPLRGSSSVSLGALAEWMSRSMKQISDADGRSTWWVRDYRISSAQLPALLDALLHSGQTQPDRIMLNGALLWQNSSISQRATNGD